VEDSQTGQITGGSVGRAVVGTALTGKLVGISVTADTGFRF